MKTSHEYEFAHFDDDAVPFKQNQSNGRLRNRDPKQLAADKEIEE